MPRETIHSDGIISYRTKLMTLAVAARFARCLDANASRFCDVAIVPSDRAKGEKNHFVEFRPVNRERQMDMIERQQEARRQRAAEEGLEYIFWADPDHTGSYWCFNPKSGETYEVSIFSCTCPDYEFRCKRACLQCKHQQAWELQKSLGMIGKTDKNRSQTPRSAEPVAPREESDLERIDSILERVEANLVPPVETREGRRARIAANIAVDFP